MAGHDQALEWLFRFTDWERGIGWGSRTSPDLSWNLGRTRWLLDALGSPDRAAPVVLIAGTKGKGSTAAIIERIARSAGHRTSLYTQPHLHHYRERIRLDGEPVSESAFARLVDRVRDPVAMLMRDEPAAGEPTTYEITTALAMLAARDHRADLAVVEVGLGGRLDATNCLDPVVSVLTRVSYDHTQILGSTLGAIAREKVAIARPGRALVSAPQRPAARRAIVQGARAIGARHRFVDPLARGASPANAHHGQPVRGSFLGQAFECHLRLLGEHQRENAAVAVAVCEELARGRTLAIAAQHVRLGLGSVFWPGRMELVSESPRIVLDGAHNGESADRLIRALRESFQFERLILVLGILRDKDAQAMLQWLLPASDELIVTSSSSSRSREPMELARLAQDHGKKAFVAANVASALSLARELAGHNDLICVTGSLTVVAEARHLECGE
jgi:dihydrofolate synthase / folylpolyglutamate synthase